MMTIIIIIIIGGGGGGGGGGDNLWPTSTRRECACINQTLIINELEMNNRTEIANED